MFNIFFEKKFLFYAETNRNKDYMTDELGEQMANGGISDVSAARDIMERLNSLRSDMQRSSLLTNEDQSSWQRKIDDVKEKPTHDEVKKLEEEFRKEQKSIKSMVEGYTAKLNANKENAFAVDELKGVNTVNEYLNWFMTLSAQEKQKAFANLDEEIKERADLRSEILKTNPELKSEVIKMDRTAMKEKLKELEDSKENIKSARFLLERDSKYFKDIREQLNDLKDKTPDEQKRWLADYGELILKPKKELFEEFESLPKEYQEDEFFNLDEQDKKIFLEKLEAKIENDFMKAANEIPDNVWSIDTKKFAIKEFFNAEGLKDKAARLKMLPEFVKAEKKLTNEYKILREKVNDIADYSEKKWERLNFEEKEDMLMDMEAETFMLKNFTNLLNNKKDKNIISERTCARMMTDYCKSSKEKRLSMISDFTSAMNPREELFKNFMSMSEETRNHFKEKFITQDYNDRLETFKAATEFEKDNAKNQDKNKESDIKESMPQPLNSPEIKAIVDNLKLQADLYEDQGKIEQALGIHESIIKIDPQNKYSAEKIKDLKIQTEAMDAANKASKTFGIDPSLKNEIEKISQLEGLIKDKENQIAKANGAEEADKQTSHLGDDGFKHGLHKSIFKNSGGRKILSKDGKVKDTYDIDIDYFGERQSSEIKKKKEAEGEDANLVETRFSDKKTGKILSFAEAKRKVEQRKQNAAKKIAESNGINYFKAEDLINEKIKKAA